MADELVDEINFLTTETDRCVVLSDEVQLLGYGETDSTGPWVKFRLLDPDQLAHFRGQEKSTANKVGKRYAMCLVEIGDDEKPIVQHTEQEANDRDKSAQQCAMMLQHPLLPAYLHHICMVQALHGWDQVFLRNWNSRQELKLFINDFEEILLEYMGVERKRDIKFSADAVAKFREFQQLFYRWVRDNQELMDANEAPKERASH